MRRQDSRCPTSINSRTGGVHTKTCFINTGQQRPMRAPGHPQGSFITEVLMEELADLVKMDPVEFRIKNLPPEAPNAMWGQYLRRGRCGVRVGQAASDR